ncbi:MAG: PEP/pyruvate-binding domain-containing protein [Ignavibacteriaceae bacterium]|nr:PEP/pyruvate-binding domain-containing protein [Ignavibacteriaceae bacterium]
MDRSALFDVEDIFSSRIKEFQKLMRYKIREILLVSSLYDYYLFEEDGRLYELLREEYQLLNLSQAPEITHVTTGSEALELAITENTYDLIITTLHIEDMHVIKFAQMIRRAGLTIPIVLLAYDNKERKELIANYDTSIFDRIFIWQGDFRLLIGIVKYAEDRINVENDTSSVGVQVIILVEDNVKFYSTYLPLIYTEVFKQSQRLIYEGVNITHKFLRMRARPKILLCTTYEEAWQYYTRYEEFILGIITDSNFRHMGIRDPEAGIKFAKTVKARHEDIPILLQSSNPDFEKKAYEAGISFLLKGSPRLLHNLRDFMLKNFGFGDFIFQTPDGKVVGRAANLKTLEEQLKAVPIESILYHAERNHFSKWLKARTEFWLAHKLRPRKVSEFETIVDLRDDLISSINIYQELRLRGIITEFSKESFDPKNSFARIGSGSLGGKARGLGFVNTLINTNKIRYKFENVEISVPSAIVIATDVFDQFLDMNRLDVFTLSSYSDSEITKKFTETTVFPADIKKKLLDFLETVKEPLAVRSSSLLEDSQFQPFAGVYQTFMIPNKDPDINVRLYELLHCIKSVYASTYCKKAQDYMKATSYRLEEEKMAVIVQRLVGSRHDDRFYPDFAGVAKSYNFYPVPPQKSTDGIAMVALGLGKQVVDGGNAVRFCPKYPRHLLQFYSTKETIRNAQQEFYALVYNGTRDSDPSRIPEELVKQFDLSYAEKDQTLYFSGSTYSVEDDEVYDGISRKGRRVVTFASILKQKTFPLAEILDMLLDLGSWGMGVPVEIEFAVNLNVLPGHPKDFAMLQMRPLVISQEIEELNVDNYNHDDLICQSRQVLGNGAVNEIHDVIVVDINKFDRSKSRDVALEISRLNSKLLDQKKPYILIGVGRWGSLDHWLGIPVTWDMISGASVIVESGFKDINVTPSQGSHFFQNITSFKVGYFTVDPANNQDYIDWEWLSSQIAVEELNFTKHLFFEESISVKINGHQNKGVILKPGKQ